MEKLPITQGNDTHVCKNKHVRQATPGKDILQHSIQEFVPQYIKNSFKNIMKKNPNRKIGQRYEWAFHRRRHLLP